MVTARRAPSGGGANRLANCEDWYIAVRMGAEEPDQGRANAMGGSGADVWRKDFLSFFKNNIFYISFQFAAKLRGR